MSCDAASSAVPISCCGAAVARCLTPAHAGRPWQVVACTVGQKPSRAPYYLNDAQEVLGILSRMVNVGGGRHVDFLAAPGFSADAAMAAEPTPPLTRGLKRTK